MLFVYMCVKRTTEKFKTYRSERNNRMNNSNKDIKESEFEGGIAGYGSEWNF